MAERLAEATTGGVGDDPAEMVTIELVTIRAKRFGTCGALAVLEQYSEAPWFAGAPVSLRASGVHR